MLVTIQLNLSSSQIKIRIAILSVVIYECKTKIHTNIQWKWLSSPLSITGLCRSLERPLLPSVSLSSPTSAWPFTWFITAEPVIRPLHTIPVESFFWIMGIALLQWFSFFDPDDGLLRGGLSLTIRSGSACVKVKYMAISWQKKTEFVTST